MESLMKPKPLILEGDGANWKKFKQQIELYLSATGLTKEKDDRKIAIFLNIAGESAIDLFNTFKLSDEDKQKYDKVLEAFENHCEPKKNVIFESFKFFSRMQKEERLIRDRIVVGITDKTLQERLLREVDLTLTKAINYCRAAEVGKIQMKTLLGKEETVEIDNIKIKKYTEKIKCTRCDKNHQRGQCPAFGKLCSKCKKKNHFATVCKTNQNTMNKKPEIDKREKKVREIKNTEDSSDENSEKFYYTNLVDHKKVDRVSCKKNVWNKCIKINGFDVDFRIDTGADINILPLQIFKKIRVNEKLTEFKGSLIAYGGTKLKTVGEVKINCKPNNRDNIKLKCVVADVKSDPILGLDSAIEIGIIQRIDNIVDDKQMFMLKYKEVFQGLGKLPHKYQIHLNKDAIPSVKPVRRIPEKIKPKLKIALKELQKQSIIEEVKQPTDWVNDLVIVEKSNGKIRLCLNPSELNKYVKREHHAIPTVEELTANLAGKSVFTVLDMKDGFHQIELTEESSLLCTFNTPYGRYKFKRLPFGLSSSPEVFQRENSRLFGQIPGVQVYFDDIIVAGKDEAEHDQILDKVMNCALNYNVKFNLSKLQYKVDKVLYVGLEFSKLGVKPDARRVSAINDMPAPSNKKELQIFLGMVTYLHKFLPNLAQISYPLRNLLKNKVKWNWDKTENDVFHQIKLLVTEAPTLAYFNPESKIIIQTDASNKGLGCCLLQNNRPIAYASRSLSPSEMNYPIIEKELLGIVFACERYHQFIYGSKIEIQTDHKPLIHILTKPLHKSTNRIQRLRLKLMNYNLEVTYKPGKELYVADLLSRLIKNNKQPDDPDMNDIVHTVSVKEYLGPSQFLNKLRSDTNNNENFASILSHIDNNWNSFNPKKSENSIQKHFYKLRHMLFNNDGIILYDDKIVVPPLLRRQVLKIAHGKAHLGINKTKHRLRQNFYWPNVVNEIENYIKKCEICEKYQKSNKREPLISHEIPELPFEKIGMDIAEHGSKNYLIVVDYLSKWLDIIPIKTKTCQEIITKLKILFSNFGIPKYIVSDNSPFNCYEYNEFTKQNNIQPIYSSPRYPKSNGLAEKGVEIAKGIIKKSENFEEIIEALLDYRTAPVANSIYTPSQILMSRQLRNNLIVNEKLLKPQIVYDQARQLFKQNSDKVKQYYDRGTVIRTSFSKGDKIVYYDTLKQIWKPGIITDTCQAPRSYKLLTTNGKVIRRNSFHIKKSLNKMQVENSTYDDYVDSSGHPPISTEDCENRPKNVSRYGRVRNPPHYLKDFVTNMK